MNVFQVMSNECVYQYAAYYMHDHEKNQILYFEQIVWCTIVYIPQTSKIRMIFGFCQCLTSEKWCFRKDDARNCDKNLPNLNHHQ